MKERELKSRHELELQAFDEAFENSDVSFTDAMLKLADARLKAQDMEWEKKFSNDDVLRTLPFDPNDVARSWQQGNNRMIIIDGFGVEHTSFGSTNVETFYEMSNGELFRKSPDGQWHTMMQQGSPVTKLLSVGFVAPLTTFFLFLTLSSFFTADRSFWIWFAVAMGILLPSANEFQRHREEWVPVELKYSENAQKQLDEIKKTDDVNTFDDLLGYLEHNNTEDEIEEVIPVIKIETSVVSDGSNELLPISESFSRPSIRASLPPGQSLTVFVEEVED